jgi:hypothetical protein
VAVSDDVLRAELRGYTKRVVEGLSYAECVRLHDSRAAAVVTYEGREGEPGFLTFQWRVLDLESISGRGAARLSTDVCDDRAIGLGSVYTPLCCGAWIFEDGKVEYFPLGNSAVGGKWSDF